MTTKAKNISGSRIREARLKKKWTQTELSKKLGHDHRIGRVPLAKIELGQRQVYDYELVRFAEVLDVDVKWLLKGGKL